MTTTTSLLSSVATEAYNFLYYIGICILVTLGVAWLLLACFLVLNDQRKRQIRYCSFRTLADTLDCCEYFNATVYPYDDVENNGTKRVRTGCFVCRFKETPRPAISLQLKYYLRVLERAGKLMYWSARAAVTATKLSIQIYWSSRYTFQDLIIPKLATACFPGWYSTENEDEVTPIITSHSHCQSRSILPPSTTLHMMTE